MSFLDKALRFKSLTFKDGKLYICNIAGFITPLSINSYFWRLLQHQFGEKKFMQLFYTLGRFQGYHATKIITKKFGFSLNKTYDKKKVLDSIISQGAVGGHGSFEFIIKDFVNDFFVMKGNSSMAEDYKYFFGLQKQPIDHFFRGQVTSILEELTNKKMFCIEKECIAMGKKYCIFVVRPQNIWDKRDPLFVSQFVEALPFMKELGAKKKLYFYDK